jgi:hypothetical protein
MAEGHTDHEGRDLSARFLERDNDLVRDSVARGNRLWILPGPESVMAESD